MITFLTPFHTSFPEVNLRFYIRYKENGEWKRGVSFIKEIVPRRAISFVANTLFNERYQVMPMKRRYEKTETGDLSVGYYWKKKGNWNNIEVTANAKPLPLLKNSREEFITEHFWGYSFIDHESTGEYHVKHPRWNIHPVMQFNVNCDFESIYGKGFGKLQTAVPDSVFLADGSSVSVYSKRIL